jgi:hypothetical protein
MSKFKAGDVVSYRPSKASGAPRGAYEITRPLPADSMGLVTYRIRSMQEDHERVAAEHELTKLVDGPNSRKS